jgi:NADPH:quinone reductase-like Zn-dependent oxidoreductase
MWRAILSEASRSLIASGALDGPAVCSSLGSCFAAAQRRTLTGGIGRYVLGNKRNQQKPVAICARVRLPRNPSEDRPVKAIVVTQYGPPEVLQLQEVAIPAPAQHEVLVHLYASSVNPLDSFLMRGPLFFLPALSRLLKPKHRGIGADIAGRVQSLGSGVTHLQPGDEVFGGAFGRTGLGACAEYVCVHEDRVVAKPTNLSFEAAAAVPVAAVTALQGLRDHGRIKPGQGVLIEGASGGVGTFAVQIAKAFGAEVTAVCSPTSGATARSLGADHVLDYTREDFTRGTQRYDLILGVNAHHSIVAYLRALRPGGTLVMIGGSVPLILQAWLWGPLLSRVGSKQMRFFIAQMKTRDLVFLKDLLEAGKIVAVIDRRYPLSETAEAIRYLEKHHAQGKVVITIDPNLASQQPLRPDQPAKGV